MIKYLGSKRTLVPVLGRLAGAIEARTALDLFTGTTRVAQEFCRRGAYVTAVDTARYSEVFARTYVEADAARVDLAEVRAAVDELNALPGQDGYVTETYCRRSRYFQPHNGRRIDAVRQAIEERWAGTWLWPVLVTSLLEAADAVDSTVGLQMAYLKTWSPRSYQELHLEVPSFTPGTGRAVRADAVAVTGDLPPVDLAYLDPRTTSTATTRTTTSGRRWSGGTSRRSTGSPASGSTVAMRRRRVLSTAAARWPPPLPRCSATCARTSWRCPSTTSRSSAAPRSRRCVGPARSMWRCSPSMPGATSGR
nr:DNA adenine methylase [Raineyella fluvialis]